jgi:hypothetical protein
MAGMSGRATFVTGQRAAAVLDRNEETRSVVGLPAK